MTSTRKLSEAFSWRFHFRDAEHFALFIGGGSGGGEMITGRFKGRSKGIARQAASVRKQASSTDPPKDVRRVRELVDRIGDSLRGSGGDGVLITRRVSHRLT